MTLHRPHSIVLALAMLPIILPLLYVGVVMVLIGKCLLLCAEWVYDAVDRGPSA